MSADPTTAQGSSAATQTPMVVMIGEAGSACVRAPIMAGWRWQRTSVAALWWWAPVSAV
jgi:hypothetical protein